MQKELEWALSNEFENVRFWTRLSLFIKKWVNDEAFEMLINSLDTIDSRELKLHC